MPRRKRSSINDYNPDNFILLTGSANPKLAKDIAKILKKDIYDPVSTFADGEVRVKIPPNMRRRHVFIIQPTAPPVNDSLMELIFMIDAAKRSSANEVSVIIPYFGYARQDRKEQPHVPISSSVVASMLITAGADRIVTVDIHSEQQQGFVKVPWDNLYSSYALLPLIKKMHLKNLIIASPDKGGMTRATGYARRLGASGVALVYKKRDISVNDLSESLGSIGEIKGKDVLIVDDMISKGGTLLNAAKHLKDKGARSVRAAVTHGLFTGDSLEQINKSKVEEIIVSDTTSHREEVVKNPKITIVSVAPLLAEAIRRIETGESISKDLIL